jgi:hypothetical protein
MKKFLLSFLILFIFATVAVAAPYWLPRQYFDTDQRITTSSTILYDMTIYWRGVTVGDRVTFRNGTTTSATAFYSLVAPTASGTFVYIPPKPLVVDGGIYYDVTLTGGSMGVSITYQE